MKKIHVSRRGFIKTVSLAAGYAAIGAPLIPMAGAAEIDFVGTRQKSVYQADTKIYKIRKSQDNPMVQKLYDPKHGFLHDGPGGHMSHHLLHTHYVDRSERIKALKEKGFQLSL
ncbi:iron hydrogenase small subunit [Desulfospira joergensenii]|uniref:iron hydrogenase small subunit n=1 Tax=Desulfospira joergensenii TaxID=53329 RepID=UPI0003B51CD0|nr:iron hydrogenase small subunit [Desulfospira joergensenii]